MPVITTTWLLAPIGVLNGIYAKYFGLSLSTIASVILFARLFDAISDPMVGYYCDRYYRRNGTRKPFILLGGVLFIISSYFLYVPFGIELPINMNNELVIIPTSVSPYYFAIWFIAFYMASTLFEIPHITWAGELAESGSDKAKIYSYRGVSIYLGLLIFYCIPMLPIFQTTEITPQSLQVSVISASILMLFFLTACVKIIPDNLLSKKSFKEELISNNKYNIQSNYKNNMLDKKNKLEVKNYQASKNIFHDIKTNIPFQIFMIAFLLASMGSGVWYGLIFIYIDTYLRLGEQFAPMFMLAFAIGVFAAPLWGYLAIHIGKKAAWVLSTILMIFSFFYTSALSPGETDLSNLVLLKVMNTLGFVCINVLGPAMVSELSDYGSLKSGIERPASYFAIYAFTIKTAAAISGALGLAIAGWYGFDATAGTHSEEGIFGITFAIVWVPIIFQCLALFFIILTPITAQRHQIIRRRLEARSIRSNLFLK